MAQTERGAENRVPTLAEIKADLSVRCAKIPLVAWQRFSPDLQIPIGTYMTSTLLPEAVSHTADGKGRPLVVPHTIGHDEVQTFLDREGRVMEKLVHYSSDGYDSDRRSPDEVLGETSEDRYRWAYGVAVNKLSWLERRAAETPLAAQQF